MDKGERTRTLVKVWHILISGGKHTVLSEILAISCLVTKLGFWKIRKFIEGFKLILCGLHLKFFITGIKNYTSTLLKLLLIISLPCTVYVPQFNKGHCHFN